MLFEEKALRYWIDNFYGYGSWHARFWFVGNEESGGDVAEEVAEKLNYFFNLQEDNTPALCDIREMYRHVAFRVDGPRAVKFSNLNDHRFGSHATLHCACYQEFATPDSTLCYKTIYGLKPVAPAMDICYAKIRISA